MASQGPNFPASGANDATVGSTVWANVGRITADDGSSADCNKGNPSEYALGTQFGFSIATGATILGILLEVKCQDSTSATTENSIRLFKAGSVVGSDKSTGATLPSGSLTYVSYGGSSDLWGTTWSAADINNTGFGAGFSIATSSADPLVDAMRITVTYTPPPPPGAPQTNWSAVRRAMYR